MQLQQAIKDPEKVNTLSLTSSSIMEITEQENTPADKPWTNDLSIFTNLETVVFYCLPNKRILASLERVSTLKSIEFSNTDLRKVPDSICKLTQLEGLFFQYEALLKEIPTWIGELTKLKDLSFYGCYAIENLPIALNQLSLLEQLTLSESRQLKHIPFGLQNLPLLDDESRFELTRLNERVAFFNQLDRHFEQKINRDAAIINFLDKHQDKHCRLDLENIIWDGIFFNWLTLENDLKDGLAHTEHEILIEYPHFIPIGVFLFETPELSFKTVHEFFQATDYNQIEMMILLDPDNYEVSYSGLVAHEQYQLSDLKISTSDPL